MKLPKFIIEVSLHFRTARVVINALAWVIFPAHRAFYASGMRRGLHRPEPSRLGILLAVNRNPKL